MHKKVFRFFFRTLKNIICSTFFGRNLLFPKKKLAERFGKDSGEYSWKVFSIHKKNLLESGFVSAKKILEVGPGRNIGTAILWWVNGYTSGDKKGPGPQITLYDYYENIKFTENSISEIAAILKKTAPQGVDENFLGCLEKIANKNLIPNITYLIGDSSKLMEKFNGNFDLIYSHACLEHIWKIKAFYKILRTVTANNGYHSHRIDLADHGRRESNFVEMLEWSNILYYITMRNIPGAINRWRACDHISFFKYLGFEICNLKREMREKLPYGINSLSRKFREYDIQDLLTTGIEFTAKNKV